MLKFVRKILLVAMISVVALNADVRGMASTNGIITAINGVPLAPPLHGSSVDFNSIATIVATIIPNSLQPKLYHDPVVGAPDRRCIYFTVINNAGVPPPAGFTHAVQHVPVPANEHNIYFPIDGSQPTTAEAARYSCANINDNRVTEWYMKMFGVIPFQNTVPANNYIKAGWTAIPAATSIVNINTTLAGTPRDFKKLFLRTFRTIASDPVGRVLLYRILIEIRRRCAIGNGVCEMAFVALHDRNNCRAITVNHDPDIGLVIGQGIDFHFDPVQTALLHIQHNMIFTRDMARTPDIALFHEMTHWFHYLRNPDRYNNDKTEDHYQYLTRSYYASVSELFTWSKAINNEEIRTILGTPNYAIQNIRNLIPATAFFNIAAHGREQVINAVDGLPVPNHFVLTAQKFLNGDDLSENAYRMSRHTPPGNNVRMRWGHGEPIAQISIDNATNTVNDPDNIFNTNRFLLANLVARQCYNDVAAIAKVWELRNGATEP